MKRRTFLQIGAMLLGSTQMGLELLGGEEYILDEAGLLKAEQLILRQPAPSSLGEMLQLVYDKGAITSLQNVSSPMFQEITLGGKGFNFPVGPRDSDAFRPLD